MLRPKLRLQEGPTPLVACPCPFPSAFPVVEAVLAAAAVVAVGAPLVGDAVAAAAVAAAVDAVGAPVADPLAAAVAPAAVDAVGVPVADPLAVGAAPAAVAPAAA